MTLLPFDEPDLDAHALRVVRAVSESGSITAAAASLGYSQPAVSQQLKRLERSLGMPVIERAGRGVRLTEAGEILARHAITVTMALDAASGELTELRGLRSGLVRIAAFPSASAAIVPGLLARMVQKHPGITVTYLEAEPPEAVQAVRENRVDLAITFSYPGDRVDPHRESAQGLAVMELAREEMRVVLPVGHRLADSGAVNLADLDGENWIGGCPRCRGHLLELCDRRGFTPRVAFETDNAAAVLGLVQSGIGVAMLPMLAIGTVRERSGVAILPTAEGDSRMLHAVTAIGADRIPAVAATLRQLVAHTVAAPSETDAAQHGSTRIGSDV